MHSSAGKLGKSKNSHSSHFFEFSGKGTHLWARHTEEKLFKIRFCINVVMSIVIWTRKNGLAKSMDYQWTYISHSKDGKSNFFIQMTIVMTTSVRNRVPNNLFSQTFVHKCIPLPENLENLEMNILLSFLSLPAK